MPVVAAGSSQAAKVFRQAYDELTSRLFREVQPAELLGPAWTALTDDARRQGLPSSAQLTRAQSGGTDSLPRFLDDFSRFLAGDGAGLNQDRLTQAAIRGMTAAVGDSHTRYLTPGQSASQSGDSTYNGIGVVTPASEGPGMVINEVYANSPAERAGLRAGDRIVRVNGLDVSMLSRDQISAQIRGEPGTTVTIGLLAADGSEREATVTRARITPPVINSRLLEDGIGYLRVAEFPCRTVEQNAAADFERALLALQGQGARAYILDLRGNPGGDPNTTVDIASNFSQDGPIFVAVDRAGKRIPYPPNRRRTLVVAPLVVLIDGASASGAEVVASALSEYGEGYLIGTRTCGCLSVGQPVHLDDTSEIIVTVQQALTGRYERSLEANGLEPNEVVRSARTAGVDAPLARATEYLEGKLR